MTPTEVPTAGRVDGSGDRADNQGQVLTPITQELRDSAERYCNFKDENIVKFTEGEFDRLCDAIDAIHANLERENAELRKRTMYPAECDLWCVALDTDEGCWNMPSILRHHHPPTIEDVLREFAEKVTDSQIPGVHPTYEEAISEYAKRLRLKEDE